MFNSALKRIKRIMSVKESGIVLAMLGLVLILALISPRFFTVDNLLNIGRQTAIVGIMAIGLGMVMIAGNIDLSIGSIYGITAVITALILKVTGNTALSLCGGFAVGLVIGVCNGLLVVKIKMPSFIATFGMMYVARGIALIITLGYPITLLLEGVTPDSHPVFYFVGQGLLFNKIPMQFVFMILTMLIATYLLHENIFGLHIFSVGSNEIASFASGINVTMVRFLTYIISGFLSSGAGILSLSFIGSILPTAGRGLEFEVFAAVIIGGVSMSGGEGSIFGIFIGSLIFGIIRNGLVLLGIGPFWQVFVIGIITISAVAYDSLTWQKRQERVVSE